LLKQHSRKFSLFCTVFEKTLMIQDQKLEDTSNLVNNIQTLQKPRRAIQRLKVKVIIRPLDQTRIALTIAD